jgi:hypothetical protein
MSLYIVRFDNLVTSIVATIAAAWSAATVSHRETAPSHRVHQNLC